MAEADSDMLIMFGRKSPGLQNGGAQTRYYCVVGLYEGYYARKFYHFLV